MVGCRGHRANTVVARRETASNRGSEKTLAITGVVDTLEEGELSGIQCCGRVQAATQVLNSHVSMTNNLAT